MPEPKFKKGDRVHAWGGRPSPSGRKVYVVDEVGRPFGNSNWLRFEGDGPRWWPEGNFEHAPEPNPSISYHIREEPGSYVVDLVVHDVVRDGARATFASLQAAKEYLAFKRGQQS